MTQNELTTTTNTTALQAPAGFAELVADWHTYLDSAVTAGELAATSRTTYKVGMRKFSDWLLESGNLATAAAMRDWKTALLKESVDKDGKRIPPAKPASVNVWLSGVRAFYAWANEYERMTDNPAARVKGAKRSGTTKMHKRDTLTNAEVIRLLDLDLELRSKALLVLFLYCGIRQIEAERANVEDIGTRDGEKVLYVQGKGQTTKDDFVVITAEAEAALAAWLSERAEFTNPNSGALFISYSDRNSAGRLSLRAIRNIVKKAFRSVGIVGDRKTTHSLRHTAISNVIKNGGTTRQAQGMARHASGVTTERYITGMDRLQNAAEKLINYRGAPNK